ncbi:MAG TPA: C25 family cysteine peptidase [Verrucomicrobiota bacterium]|nr:C25 family cysteine peptidase [Verrucomicrobiota bacterium]
MRLERLGADFRTRGVLVGYISQPERCFSALGGYRSAQGRPAEVVTIEDVAATYPGIDMPERIRHCVRHYHASRGTRYLAIGGDDTIVPTRYCGDSPADLYYADMDGGSWDTTGDGLYGTPDDVGVAVHLWSTASGRLTRCRFVGNEAGSGAAIAAEDTAWMEARMCLAVSNVARANGGAGVLRQGLVTLRRRWHTAARGSGRGRASASCSP